MNIAYLIQHPEQLNRDTLYELRSLLAVHPYYQTARLLMLQNLYLLHDRSFEEELHRSAIYITQREQLFRLVEQLTASAHSKATADEPAAIQPVEPAAIIPTTEADSQEAAPTATFKPAEVVTTEEPDSTPQPKEEPAKETTVPSQLAAIDYVAYLAQQQSADTEQPALNGQPIIERFLEKTPEELAISINLNDDTPQPDESEVPLPEAEPEGEYFTETLAKIYIRQGKFEKALEIIQQLNLNFPKKSRYFADQIRFLEKLIKNNNKINKEEK